MSKIKGLNRALVVADGDTNRKEIFGQETIDPGVLYNEDYWAPSANTHIIIPNQIRGLELVFRTRERQLLELGVPTVDYYVAPHTETHVIQEKYKFPLGPDTLLATVFSFNLSRYTSIINRKASWVWQGTALNLNADTIAVGLS